MKLNKLLTVSEVTDMESMLAILSLPLPLLTIRATFAAVYPRSVLPLKV